MRYKTFTSTVETAGDVGEGHGTEAGGLFRRTVRITVVRVTWERGYCSRKEGMKGVL